MTYIMGDILYIFKVNVLGYFIIKNKMHVLHESQSNINRNFVPVWETCNIEEVCKCRY